jgi:hypothetical protein
VVLFGGGQPHRVVSRLVALIAQYKDNFLLNVDRKAAEHGPGLGRQRSNRCEDELMLDGLALLDDKEGVVQREKARFLSGLLYRSTVSGFTSKF